MHVGYCYSAAMICPGTDHTELDGHCQRTFLSNSGQVSYVNPEFAKMLVSSSSIFSLYY